jgi:hypothetical protein
MSFTPAKRPAEKERFAFDFAALLASGETIVDATWSVSVKTGVDPAAAAMISGLPVIAGAKVVQLVVGGTADVEYMLHCVAQTSDGQALELCDSIWVRACT